MATGVVTVCTVGGGVGVEVETTPPVPPFEGGTQGRVSVGVGVGVTANSVHNKLIGMQR